MRDGRISYSEDGGEHPPEEPYEALPVTPKIANEQQGSEPHWTVKCEALALENWPEATPSQRKYLWWLAKTASPFLAEKYTHTTRKGLNKWKRNQPMWDEWVRGAWEEAQSMMESHVVARAKEGSNILLVKWLEANMPEKYGKKVEMTVSQLPDKRIELMDARPVTIIDAAAKARELTDGSQ